MSLALSKRGVLYVGHKCNLNCAFCYYKNIAPEKKSWYPLNDLVKKIHGLRFLYGNQFVDLTGGEPSLHPQIGSIIKYCRDIGLLPTIITNGLRLKDRAFVSHLIEMGLHDVLLSTHGLGPTYDWLVGRVGSSEDQRLALENLVQAGVPCRFNVILLEEVAQQLDQLGTLACDSGIRVVNLINFNLLESWTETSVRSLEPRIAFNYDRMMPLVARFLDRFSDRLEINLRYVPLCRLKGYEKHIYNWRQLPFDPHEWDLNSWHNLKGVDPDSDWYNQQSKVISARKEGYDQSGCIGCSMSEICDGPQKLYSSRYGSNGFVPYEGPRIEDPTHWIASKNKLDCFYFKKSSPRVELDSAIISLESLANQFKLSDRGLEVSPNGEIHSEIPLGYYEPPFEVEASVSGPADQVGFSLGQGQDFCYKLDDQTHILNLRVEANGEIFPSFNHLPLWGKSRDMGNLYVVPPRFVRRSYLSLKGRQSSFRLHNLIFKRVASKDPKIAILLTSIGYSRRLLSLLHSLQAQSFRDFEVHVAYLPGRDDTEWLLEAFSERYRLPIYPLALDQKMGSSKALAINNLLWKTCTPYVLITDADIIFPPNILEELVARKEDHLSTYRCLLPRGVTEEILLGKVNPVLEYDRILQENHSAVTKWGGVLKFYTEDPALGYFQWVRGDLARDVGYPTRYKGFSGSDDMFSLSVLRLLNKTCVPMLDKPVLHLNHGKSNWEGLPGCQWL